MGHDGILPKPPKEMAQVTAGPLSITYPRFQESGEVPGDWKLANVLPVCKKGMRKDTGNYRPVGLTSAPVKIINKVILGTTETHLKNNGVIRHSQHGLLMIRSPVR